MTSRHIPVLGLWLHPGQEAVIARFEIAAS